MKALAQLKEVRPPSRAVADALAQRGAAPPARGRHQLSALQERANHRPQVRHAAQLRQVLNAGPLPQSPVQRAENRTGLPDRLKAGIEGLSNLSLDDVRVEYNSPKPARFQAHAITQGKEIHVGPGQEHHLPHEAWHVVQQKQGRVRATTQMHGAPVNTDFALEREADVMGERASRATPERARASVGPEPSSGGGGSQPVGQLFPWELLPLLSGTYGAFVMHNYLMQQDIKNTPHKYAGQTDRLRAVYETSKGKPGQAAHAMHWPVSLFHLTTGNYGSSNIGGHYAYDIPHWLTGTATDANLKQVGKIETNDFWRTRDPQKEWLAHRMGNMIGEKGRSQILINFRDMHLRNAKNPTLSYRMMQSLMKTRAVPPSARLLPALIAGVGAISSASLAYNKYGRKEEE